MLTETSSSRKLFLAYIAWWCLCSILQVVILYQAGLSWLQASADGLISNALLALFCAALINVLRYYSPGEANSVKLLPWTIVLAGVWLWCAYEILSFLFSGYLSYMFVLKQSLVIRYCFAFLMVGWFVLLTWVLRSRQDLQENEKHKQDIEKMAKEAELSVLRQQLQPHFLFNSLNSISALVNQNASEAKRMIQLLSDFLRSTLKKDEQQMTCLKDELEQLSLYLDIEKVRFGNRLSTVIESEQGSLGLSLPSLLLQPLVENAIKYGLYDTLGPVTIRINTRVEGKMLVVSIANPFDPSTFQPQGTGFGLSSVKRRLYLLFGRNDLLQNENNENHYITTIKIPQHD